MGFLDTVIKDSGNEFASKVSDGVAAGDTSSFEVFHPTKSLHWQENPQQEKLSLPLVLYATFLITIATVGLFTLSLNLLSVRI